MREQFQHLRERVGTWRRPPAEEEPEERHDDGFGVLQVLAAQLLLLTGVGSTLDALARERHADAFAGEEGRGRERSLARRGSLTAAWAPTLLGPMAALAHLKHVSTPSDSTSTAARVLDSAVVGAGVAGLAEALLSARRTGEYPTLTPVALAAAGVLGLMLERRAREIAAERERLERRASIVERLVPKRRPRLDHIVVHV